MKIEYDLVKEGISKGRPAIILTVGKLDINECTKKIRKISEEKDCKFLFINENENQQLQLIKILVNLYDDKFETELFTNCTIMPDYNLRAYITRFTVKILHKQKISKEAFISFANNEKSNFIFEIKKPSNVMGINSMIRDYSINKEKVMIFSNDIEVNRLNRICLKNGLRR